MGKEYKPLVIYPSGRMKPISKEKKEAPQKLKTIAVVIALLAVVFGSCYIGLLKNEKHLEKYQQEWEAAVDGTVEQDQKAVEESLEEIRQRGK